MSNFENNEKSPDKRKILDHQLDIANQKLLFKMLNYLISSRHSQSVEISNCNSASEAIDKIKLRISYLENRVNMLKQQYDTFLQIKDQNLNFLIENQKQILQKIKSYTLEKEDLEMQIQKYDFDYKTVTSSIDRIDEIMQTSRADNESLKQANESTLKNLNLIQNQNEFDLLSSNMIEQDTEQINNFDMFIHFVEGVIEK
ncbi:hypothetical protein M9Y10_033453 [Tritrichomonas musculus]|uniref:Uncharacterized protein n=1 Tax=Tritrichomonas musculus TaxID=1915356 RepID=A0ABR2KC57_9EUKA